MEVFRTGRNSGGTMAGHRSSTSARLTLQTLCWQPVEVGDKRAILVRHGTSSNVRIPKIDFTTSVAVDTCVPGDHATQYALAGAGVKRQFAEMWWKSCITIVPAWAATPPDVLTAC